MRGKNLNILYKAIPRKKIEEKEEDTIKKTSSLQQIVDCLSLVQEAVEPLPRVPLNEKYVKNLIYVAAKEISKTNQEKLEEKVFEEINLSLKANDNMSFDSHDSIAVPSVEVATRKCKEYNEYLIRKEKYN